MRNGRVIHFWRGSNKKKQINKIEKKLFGTNICQINKDIYTIELPGLVAKKEGQDDEDKEKQSILFWCVTSPDHYKESS